MPQDPGTLQSLALELSTAIAPLSSAFAGPEPLQAFLEELGWQPPTSTAAIGIDPERVNAVMGALRDVAALDTATAPAAEIAEKYALLTAAVALLARHIYDAHTRIGAQLEAAFLNAADIAAELPRRLLDYLVLRYLDDRHPGVFHALLTLGIAELRDVARDDATFTAAHVRHELHYARISQLVTDPGGLFHDVYGWGTPAADLGLLVQRLYDFALVLGIPAALVYPAYEKEVNLSAPVPVPEEGEAEHPELRLPFLHAEDGGAGAELGITLMPVPPLAAGGAPGLALCPYATGALAADVPLDAQGRWLLTLASTLDLVVGIGLLFRPGQALTVLTDILGSASSASGQATVALQRRALAGERITLLGTATGSGLTAETLRARVGLAVGTGQETEFLAELGVQGGRLRLVMDQADSFLSSLLPAQPLDLAFDFGAAWSSRRGIYFTGAGGLEYSLAVHEQLGPLRLDIIHFALRLGQGAIRTSLGVTGGARLGPLAATVESVGVDLVLTFPAVGGNLGPADLAPRFKPPAGIGLSVDAGVVRGGGYLFIDVERGEYAGALELTFSGFLSLKAIGLITTKMPDGSSGFSLLVIITAEFGTGIQLGFGFTLLAVGGLLGLNRTMRLEPLVQGVRTGAIDRIMFPRDVVANAPRIISDLRSFFPPQQGTFLIGPMAKLAWGTPPLITLSLGVIIEIPGNVAILGVLRVVLPDERAPLLVLQVSFFGAIEFDRKRVWFFASLFESRVLFMSLEGEMGVLAAFGDDANFVVSVGGFHPRFTPPPLPFPSPRRVSVDVLNSPVQRVRVEGYFAVTTNTAQFGARAELFFGFGELNVQGHIGFDALFQFSPFAFVIEVSAAFGVKVFGIGVFSVSVQMALSGPSAWRARGTGSISLFFFDISVDFDVTWGEQRDTTLPSIAIMGRVQAELAKAESWEARLPGGAGGSVTLRALPAEAGLVLHPVGVLRVSQRAVPLELTVDRVGAQRPSDAKRLELRVLAGGLARAGDAREQFAPAQFQDMTDAEKLSRPAFGPEKGGVELGAAGARLASHRAVRRTVRYEQIVLDTAGRRLVKRFFAFAGEMFSFLLRGGSIGRCEMSQHQATLLQPFVEKVAVEPEAFTVAFQADNRPFPAASFASEAGAREFMNAQLAADPALAESLHVIPAYEMAA